MSESENILSGLISDEVSNWKTKVEYRIANKSWLDKSAIIALKILKHLKKEGTSQKQLAEMVNVSPQQINKIVKGSENLTLETISRIEDALGIKLIAVENFEQTMIYEIQNSRVTKYGRLVKPTGNFHIKT